MRSSDQERQSQQLDRFFERLPDHLRASFSEEQTQAIAEALISSRSHGLDWRPVIKLPLLPWSFYLVLLAGKNRRAMSAREQRVAARTLIVLLISAIVILSILGLAVVYLIKSALGIDLIKGYHLGLWFWFEETFLGR